MWQFEEVENLNQAIQYLRQVRPIHTEIEWDDTPLVANINFFTNFPLDNPQIVEIAGNNVRYIAVECVTERARNPEFWYDNYGNLKPRNDRINPYRSKLIIFEANNSVHGITFTGLSRAGTILRDCLPVETWGSVTSYDVGISEDLLYWLFRKFIDLRDTPLSAHHNMFVTALKSYTGKTKDNVNAMRGNGKRISTILGTLAFLFNNENLKAVRPQLQYNGEVFLIEISLSGTCRIWEEEYQGNWLLYDDEIKVNNIAIYTYLILLPRLIDCYRDNIARNQWSPQQKIEFLQRLGNEIKDQVEAELERLQQEVLGEDVQDDGIDPEDLFDIDEGEDME